MKTVIIGLFLSAIVSTALAQTSLRGYLRDAYSKPLPFASVALLDAHDSTLVKGSLASEAGQYQFDQVTPGQYRVLVSMVGFEPLKSAVVTVVNSPVQMPALTLLEAARKLNEVTVVAQKPLYEQQIDRMVINVQSSITSAGATALDVLERSPGVIVDRQNNAIALNGKPGVMVMLNGRLSRLPLEAVVQMLAGMQAGNIDKIELITSPPAKYDAEGNAGLINIVTKKNANLGTNGSYSANVAYGRLGRTGGSGNINYKTDKLSLFADYSGTMACYLLLAGSNRIVTQPTLIQTVTDINRDYVHWTHNGRVGLDYQLSPKTTLSALATAYSDRQDQHVQNTSRITQGGEPQTSIAIQDHELNHSWIYTGNISARHKLTATQELSADLDYIYFFNNNPHQYQFGYNYLQEGRQQTDQLTNEKRTPLRVWVAKTDYTRAFSPKLNLELGLKATFSHFDNEIRAQRLVQNAWRIDSSLSQHVRMDETIQAAYFNLTQQFSPKTKLQAGLRYEHTVTDLRTVENQPLVYRNYGNWFPTVFLSHDLTKQSSIQLSYNRRIGRPSFNSLAPVFTILDPTWAISGNDRLLPALSDNVQTTYRFRKNFLLTFTHTQFQNAIGFIVSVVPKENRQISRPENLDRLVITSLAFSFPLQLADWWSMQTNVQAIRQASRLVLQNIGIDRSQQFIRFNTTQTFRLGHGFTAEASALYQSRSLASIATRKPFGSLNLGLQKKLRNDAGTLRLSADDVFWTQRLQSYLNNPEQGYSVDLDQRLTNRLVRLTFSRNFGNQKLKVNSARTTGSDDERKRVNN